MTRKILLPLLLASTFMLAACASTSTDDTPPAGQSDLAIDKTKNPDARYLEGNIYSLRPTESEMFVGTGRNMNSLGSYVARWTPHSKFYIDDQPATVDQVRPFMPVKIRGHMVYPNGRDHEGYMVIDVARFSSNTPPKKNPAE